MFLCSTYLYATLTTSAMYQLACMGVEC